MNLLVDAALSPKQPPAAQKHSCADHISKSDLIKLLKEVYGTGYKRTLSEELGVNYVTVYRQFKRPELPRLYFLAILRLVTGKISRVISAASVGGPDAEESV